MTTGELFRYIVQQTAGKQDWQQRITSYIQVRAPGKHLAGLHVDDTIPDNDKWGIYQSIADAIQANNIDRLGPAGNGNGKAQVKSESEPEPEVSRDAFDLAPPEPEPEPEPEPLKPPQDTSGGVNMPPEPEKSLYKPAAAVKQENLVGESDAISELRAAFRKIGVFPKEPDSGLADRIGKVESRIEKIERTISALAKALAE